MVHYCRKITENVDKTVCARCDDCKVSFKNTHQTAAAVRGRSLVDAKKYLNDVLNHKRCIPFTRYNNNIGRTAQAKEFKLTQGRWPEKSVKAILDLINNCEVNAKSKSLNIDQLYISHLAVQHAVKRRRRTFRAHGRITPYMSNPCHIEMICSVRREFIPKAPVDEEHEQVRFSKGANKAYRMRVAL